jgi:hypothetical protein
VAYRTRIGVVAVAVALSSATPAYAIDERRVESDDRGVTAEITVGDDGTPRVSPETRGSRDDCDWRVVQFPFTGSDPPARYGEPPSPEHRLYLIFCGPDFVGANWLGPSASAPEVDTEGMATTVVEHVPVDLASIDVRPEGRAVTGIPSYFWVEGYDGEAITDSITNGPVTVDVEIRLGTVTWDFGDGTRPVRAGLGQAWPERSEIRHAYRDRGSYVVTVTITLPASYRVNGGPAQELEPITRTATIPYVVDEVQAVRDR